MEKRIRFRDQSTPPAASQNQRFADAALTRRLQACTALMSIRDSRAPVYHHETLG